MEFPALETSSADAWLPMPSTLTRVLRDGLSVGHGEIVVHVDGHQDRIFIAEGAIAWVVSAGAAGGLSLVMCARGLASRATLQAVWKRCRASGRNFAEALVEEGLVSRTDMRDALREYNARQLSALAARAARGHVVFHSVERRYDSDLCFSLPELSAEVARLEDLVSTGARARVPDASLTCGPTYSPSPPAPGSPPSMSTISTTLADLMTLDGAIAAALVDWESGLTLGVIGGSDDFNVELAASGNTLVVKAKMRVMKDLGIPGAIEDVLITLESQYHIIRPLVLHPTLFLYVAIDKSRGNLGLARLKMRSVEAGLKL